MRLISLDGDVHRIAALGSACGKARADVHGDPRAVVLAPSLPLASGGDQRRSEGDGCRDGARRGLRSGPGSGTAPMDSTLRWISGGARNSCPQPTLEAHHL